MPALKASLLRLSFFFYLICPVLTKGQVWQMLGSREQDQLSSYNTSRLKLSLSPTGMPYAIFSDTKTADRSVVKKFINGKWEVVGNNPMTENYTQFIDLTFAPDASIYATYMSVIEGNTARVNVKKLVNNRWVSVGKAGIGADLSPSLTFDSNGTPYVAYSSNLYNGGVVVKKFEAGTWNLVGTIGLSSISIKNTQENKLVYYNNEFYLGYTDAGLSNKLVVKKLLNGTWTVLGSEGLSAGQASGIDMVFSKTGILHVAYQDAANSGKITVKKFEGEKWEHVGIAGFSQGTSKETSIQFLKDNTPMVVYRDVSLGNKTVIGKFLNNNWLLSEVSPNPSQYVFSAPTIRIDEQDNIYVSYVDQLMNYRSTVKKLTAGKWESVGTNGISPDGAGESRIKIDSNGIPYLAYIDLIDKSKVTVKKYINGTWQLVGSPSFTTINSKFIDLAIDLNNMPYLAFRDDGQNVRVKKFNGNDWIDVGAPVTQYQSYELKILIAPDNMPVIVYSDQGVGSKITVRKWNGTAWTPIGGSSISTGGAVGVAFAISKSGALYIAYTDQSSFTSNLTVKKLVNANWELVGNANISPNFDVNGISLAIAADETPYVSFIDGANTSRVRVKKFSNNLWTDVGSFISAGSSKTTSIIVSKDGNPIVAHQNYVLNQYNSLVSIFKNGIWSSLSNKELSSSASDFSELTMDKNGEIYFALTSGPAYVAKLVPGNTLSPQIYAFEPSRAFSGEKITITGDNFTAASSVKFGDKPAVAFTVISPTVIVAELGENTSSGLITITTPLGEASKGDFTVAIHPPVITSLSQISGTISSTITIFGNYFSTIKENNIVYFGPVKALITAATPQTIQVVVPAYSAYNRISVTVNNATAYSPKPFLIKPPKSTPNIDAATFNEKKDFITAPKQRDLGLADIDGDGKPDVVLVSGSDASFFSVYLNKSTPANIAFADRVDIFTIFTSTGLSFADIDGDGKLDVILAGALSTNFYRNTSSIGNVSFAPATAYYSNYVYPFSTSSADLDRDGRPDLICADISSFKINIHRNVAYTDSYLYVDDAVILESSVRDGITSEDLDGDGYPDLITPSNGYGINLYQNLSTPGKLFFKEPQTVLLTADTYSSIPSIADLNGDGKPELVATNESVNQIAIYKNQSTLGTLSFAARKMYSSKNSPNFTAIGDFNGDGMVDIAAVNNKSNTVSIYKNTSTIDDISLADAVYFPVGTLANQLIAGDIDGDGYPDIITNNTGDKTFSVLRNLSGKITLPANNFNVAITGTTCIGTSNGSININAILTADYVVDVINGTDKATFNFTKQTNVENLKAGTYTINIYLKSQPTDIQSYAVVITEPKALSVFSSVDPAKGILNLSLGGASTYQITLNNIEYTTSKSSINLPLKAGNNVLMVTTDLTCQGNFSKILNYDEAIKLFPSPFEQALYLTLNKPNAKSVSVMVYDSMGIKAYSKQFNNSSEGIELDLAKLPPGIYLIKINIDGSESRHKVIKK